MADIKVSGLPQITSIAEDDLLYVSDDNGLSYDSKRILFSDFIKGVPRWIRMPVDTTAIQDSATLIPANYRIIEARFEIVTSYSGGTGIIVGNDTTTNLIFDSGEINPARPSGTVFHKFMDESWGASDFEVTVTVSGAPASGSGVLIVQFVDPLL